MQLVPAFLLQGFDLMVQRGLRGVWMLGDVPESPAIWAANHHSWWDPFVASTIFRHYGRDGALVMDEENLARFGFLRRLGVVGTGEREAALAHLRDGRVLVIYPEAELRPAGELGTVKAGAAWFAHRSGAALLAVAVRVVMRGHEAPEAYVDARPVDLASDIGETTKRLAGKLHDQLRILDTALAYADPREPLPGFRLIASGRRSWDERLESWGRRLRR